MNATATAPPVLTVVETAIYVDDLTATLAFYQDVLGLTCISQEPGRSCFFRAGDRMLLAFYAPVTLVGDFLPSHGSKGPGHFALGIKRDDLEPWVRHLESRQIAIEKRVTWPRGGESVYFRDPSGNSVELLTPVVWGLESGW